MIPAPIDRALDDLIGGRKRRAVSRRIARPVLEQLAAEAAAGAMWELAATPEVADRLGVSAPTIQRLAAEHGLGRVVGTVRLFTERDIAAAATLLATRRPARPRIGRRADGLGEISCPACKRGRAVESDGEAYICRRCGAAVDVSD